MKKPKITLEEAVRICILSETLQDQMKIIKEQVLNYRSIVIGIQLKKKMRILITKTQRKKEDGIKKRINVEDAEDIIEEMRDAQQKIQNATTIIKQDITQDNIEERR